MEEQEKVVSMPRIGDPAPEFKAKTTQGDINYPSDSKGKWSILFSHPADFTPVCTTEFMSLQPHRLAQKDSGENGIQGNERCGSEVPPHRGYHHGRSQALWHDPTQ